MDLEDFSEMGMSVSGEQTRPFIGVRKIIDLWIL
jgi:hypothetical protein